MTSIGVHYFLAAAPHRCNVISECQLGNAIPLFKYESLSKSRMLRVTRLLTLWPITSQMVSIGFESGDRDDHGSAFFRLAWRRALVARTVCEGAPSCINLILQLFCRWGMQTGVSISFEYLKAFRLPLTTTHCVFIIFCDFQNNTSNDQNAISAYFASRF